MSAKPEKTAVFWGGINNIHLLHFTVVYWYFYCIFIRVYIKQVTLLFDMCVVCNY